MKRPSTGLPAQVMAFLCALLVTLTSNAANPLSVDAYLSNESLSNGEDIEGFTSTLKWRVKEFSLPGTGLNIDLYRSYGYTTGLGTLGLWHIETPRVVLNASFDYDKNCDRISCRNDGVWKIGTARLEIPGHKPLSLVKSKTEDGTFVSVNGQYGWKVTWSISDDKLTMTGYAPNGLVYRFDYLDNDISKKGIATRAIHASKVSDPYGNYLAYSYTRTRSEDSKLTDSIWQSIVLPNSITASDGRKVTFSYKDIEDFWTKSKRKLDKITVHESTGNRVWSYEYSRWSHSAPVELKRVRRPDGLSWYYTCSLTSSHPREHRLSSVTVPHGAKISYHYDYQHELDFGRVGVSKRILSIEGKDDFITTYSYDKDGNWLKFISSNPLSTKITTFHNDKSKLYYRGKIAKEQVFNKASDSQPLRTTEYSYNKWSAIGDHDYLANPVRLTRIKVDGLLETLYSNFNSHYQARTVTERLGDTSRITTLTLENKIGDGRRYIGLLRKKSVDVGIGSHPETIVATYQYNNKGRIVRKVENGLEERYDYHTSGKHTAGLLASLYYTNHLGEQVVQYPTYYRGIATEESLPERTIRRTVDDRGLITSESDGAENYTSYTYDAMGRVRSVQQPERTKQIITYTKNAITLKRAGSTFQQVVTLDGLGRSIRTDNELNGERLNFLITTYDGLGRKTFESHPMDRSSNEAGVKYTYDALSRITQMQDTGRGTMAGYCYGLSCVSGALPSDTLNAAKAAGARYAITETNLIDGKFYKTHYLKAGFGGYGYLYDVLVYRVIDQQGNAQVTKFQRNKAGLVQKVTQDGVSRSYTYYAGTDRIKMINEPERQPITYTYDESGNLRTALIEGQGRIKYYYDALNQLQKVDYPSGHDVWFRYHANGLLSYAKKGLTARTYDYSASGDLISEKLKVDIDGPEYYTLAYQYDDDGQLEKITYPNQFFLEYDLDDAGRPLALHSPEGTLISDVDYSYTGITKTYTYANGMKVSQASDKAGRITAINSNLGSTVVTSQAYSYDGHNNVTSIIDHHDSANSFNDIKYDGLSRFISADCPWGDCGARYNSRGDILSKSMGTLGSLKYFYDSDTNRLDHTTGTNYQFKYDDFGNVTDNGRFDMTYDHSGDMLSIVSKSGDIDIDYEYDAHNLRTIEIHGDKAIIQVHSKDGSVLYEENLLEDTATNYVYFDGKMIAEIERDFQAEYTCEAGWILDGDTCTKTVFAEPTEGCSENLSISNGICRWEETRAANRRCPVDYEYPWGIFCSPEQKVQVYYCDPGYMRSGKECFKLHIEPIILSCPTDYSLTGNNCAKTQIKAAIRK
ncbi:RHS repeat domain-containing protein [Hahella ganghwensis]|uniref:RHS repeat domain-containing protein n=1 Tax=Hahella ganghwensis TaxID=286420 RepID=UPI00036C6A55|nr:RHS repeat protein [Hahella ganghwensis]